MEALMPMGLSTEDWQAHAANMAKVKPLHPFSPVVVQFLQEVSAVILKNKQMRAYPELMATGYWLRKANIAQIQRDFEKRSESRILLARGVVLHFAPSNVDTIFLYSWVLSMLAGNINIVRLSQNRNEQLTLLLGIIDKVMDQAAYEEIRQRTLFLTYAHDRQISQFLSSLCHARVIWGGDQTIRTIREIPLPPLATELVFADRFSTVVLSADELIALSDESLAKLAHDFYNDAFWFQQMACSSPRLVCWVGNEQHIEQAKMRFWNALTAKLQAAQYELPKALQVTRLTTAFFYGAHSYTEAVSSAALHTPTRVEVTEMNEQIREMHCGGGLFLELSCSTLLEVSTFVSDKDQTLSYFGFTKEELKRFIYALNGRGIDRIIPVGKALDFAEVWDGYYLLSYLTREVDLR
ncbi:acyl-CoA reductase [Paenibacillus whitsoniae]|uniref:Acyl-CoA reductase n=1 Tax=Paenibacillus whitsoniae TaxID=2496558 RepID=A0A3S0A9M4_9BACL|nr:acyl-CoA reductase [Paenibacillus whitsoniae]RTE07932.1 acyl-CoA reductase [Paenibacillus whitsoniae]